MSKNGSIDASPTHLIFKIQNHNVPKKRELFMKILGIENEKIVYIEKFEKKWTLPVYYFNTVHIDAICSKTLIAKCHT